MDDPDRDWFWNLDSDRKREYDAYFKAYFTPLENRARSILWKKFRGWEHAACDCAQETLMELARALAEGLNPFATDERDQVYVKNWLYYVIRNRAYEEIRKAERHPQTRIDNLSGRGEAAEDMLLSNILREELLKELLAWLGPRERAVLRLTIEGYSDEEIANYLHTSSGYVKQLRSKAIRQLREWRRDFDV